MSKKLVKRYDAQSASSPSFVKTSQGYLRAKGVVTRTGVLTYRRADGSVVRELRHPDEVFHPDSLRSLEGVPVTNEHPPMGLLDAQNTHLYMKGFTSHRVDHDGNYVDTDVTVTDADTIVDVESGNRRDLSCGYTCELDDAPGVWKGDAYDKIQRNIRYNHLAVTAKGRAGREVGLKLDADDAVALEATQQEEPRMKEKIKIDGKEFEIELEVKKHLDSIQARLDAAQAKLDAADDDEDGDEDEEKKDGKGDEMGKKCDALEAKVDSLQAENTKLKAQVAEKADVKALVKERLAVVKVAAVTLDAETVEKLDAMDDQEIKKAVIMAEQPEAKLDGKSQAYIDARFDAIAEGIMDSDRKAVQAGKQLTTTTETKNDSASARQRSMERALKMGREPLNSQAKA